jgi:hypothetical protein
MHMAYPFTLPEHAQIVEAMSPAADAAGRTGDYIKLANAAKVYIIAHITQGNAATVALTPMQAKDATGTDAKALTANTRIWANLDCAAGDGFTKATDAKNYTTDAGLKHKLVIIEIDPAECMDLAGGFTWLTVTTGASNAANITQAIYIGTGLRYGGTKQPTVIA